MEIPLFEQDEALRFERVVLYPYPDLNRIWTRVWLTAVEAARPNIEIVLLNPDGSENTSIFALAHAEQRLETTLHVRNPRPGAVYHVLALLSDGLSETPHEIDHQEFDLVLEFRDPNKNESGFGFGVDWAQLQQT